jgi:hypothetical protein
MRWRRAIMAVVVGVLTTAAATVLFEELYWFYPVQEVVAWTVPCLWSPAIYEVALQVAVVAPLATPGIVVAVLIASRPSKPRPGHCRSCGYDLSRSCAESFVGRCSRPGKGAAAGLGALGFKSHRSPFA